MTDEELFLKWCAKHGLQPRNRGSNPASKIYVITPLVRVTLAGIEVKLEADRCDVYFNDGIWNGGTNWLWDDRLPWIRQKSNRSRRCFDACVERANRKAKSK